ncbi:MAG TPA: EF-hand domain-containing protein [Acidimicrobiales bacterium]|jgi:Ca2+-binding EF-hand superfamily protein
MVDTSRYESTFNLVDTYGDGLLSAEEMQSVMKALGEEVTAERADTIVKTIDTDGDGRISLEEFATFMEGG